MRFLLTIFLSALIVVFTVAAQADLKSDFNKLANTYKGPFSLNYMQGTLGRVAIRESEIAPGEFQFQSAFRNETARGMAAQYDFYLANLFTTNYYELTGAYVYNDQYGSFVLNQQALLAAAPQALPMAASMVRHWVLEKHFITFFPNNKIAEAFKLRGVSGAEFEQVYANYFFNFYLSAITEEFQFLPAYLLAKSSPIAESASLEKARTLIATTYDAMKLQFGEKDPGVVAMYQLRNAIHNQLSQGIIAQIDTYVRNYPGYGQMYGQSLSQIQNILRSYYNVGPSRVSELARIAGVSEVQTIADSIAANGLTTERILALSQSIANLRANVTTSAVAYDKKTAVLVLMFSASQYLNKEISSLPSVSSKEIVKAVINLLYAEGFLIKDNWQYFAGEAEAAADAPAAAALIPDIAEIANDTLTQAFQPALDQWLSIEPKMQYFVDNTIKSSALNTASIIAKKIK